ncbi:MAG: dephospho-CoA kinase [Gemmatales bacterium]|nr:dephospho-CoA kinase [Gemmatales bacterium]MDW8387595.1 dephospho-CoA kinase [Gemmatales bacterium]
MTAAKPVVGIVGGIGSGKSHVARLLAQRGGHLIQADLFGHEALRQEPIKAAVVQRWGPDVLGPDGEIDRRRLAAIVFADPQERRHLESLVFPWIERRIREEITRAERDDKVRFVVLDAAILLETGWGRWCDRIVFVDAPREVRLARLAVSRGWTEKEVDAREQAQLPLDAKKAQAHEIVENHGEAGSEPHLAAQLDRIVNRLLKTSPSPAS